MKTNSFLQHPTIHRFLIRFFLIFIASQLFLEFVSIYPLQKWLAQTVGNLLNLQVNGTFIPVGMGTAFEITAFCTGIASAAMLLGLLFGFSFPPLHKKIKWAFVGILAIFLVNIFRVALVVYAGFTTKNVALASTLHILTWFVMSALVLGGWYYGMLRLTQSKNGNALARKLLR